MKKEILIHTAQIFNYINSSQMNEEKLNYSILIT